MRSPHERNRAHQDESDARQAGGRFRKTSTGGVRLGGAIVDLSKPDDHSTDAIRKRDGSAMTQNVARLRVVGDRMHDLDARWQMDDARGPARHLLDE